MVEGAAIDKGTEEYALFDEASDGEVYAAADKHISEDTIRINALLRQDADKALDELAGLLGQPDFAERYKYNSDFKYIWIAVKISIEERNNNERKLFLCGLHSIDEVIAVFLKLRFSLWRIELAGDTSAVDGFLDCVMDKGLSPYAVIAMVQIASINKTDMLGRLAAAFLALGKLRYAYCILRCLDELKPGDEETLCAMADICMLCNDRGRAAEHLAKVVIPTSMTKERRERYGL